MCISLSLSLYRVLFIIIIVVVVVVTIIQTIIISIVIITTSLYVQDSSLRDFAQNMYSFWLLFHAFHIFPSCQLSILNAPALVALMDSGKRSNRCWRCKKPLFFQQKK